MQKGEDDMIRTASFAGAVSLLSLVSPAHAQPQLISSPLWTDEGKASACYVRNIGTTPFPVKVTLFSNNTSGADIDTCNTVPLGAGKTCVVFTTQLPADSWVACSAQASNINVSKLRGNMDIRHSVAAGAGVVVGEDLR
jgi:hypothetical protein